VINITLLIYCYQSTTLVDDDESNLITFERTNRMTYQETIRSLFEILHQCNAADGPNAADWQHPTDARRAYGHIRNAIESLAGEDVIDHCANSGELVHTLCDRTEEGKLAIHLGAMEERGEITLDGPYPTHSRIGGYAITYVHEGEAFCGHCVVDEHPAVVAGEAQPTAAILWEDEEAERTHFCECCGIDTGN
jgi:hypothetical protein